MARQQRRAQLDVRRDACARVPRDLPRARDDDARADGRRRLAAGGIAERVDRQRRHVDGEIEPIAQRPRQAIAIAPEEHRRAAALARRIVGEPARARVHRADEHEARRKDRRARRARDRHAPLLERLTQHLQDMAAELQHLVEKEDAVVREAHFAGPRLRAAAHERRVRDGVMRRAERPRRLQSSAGAQESGDRMDRGDLERFVERQRRQNAGEQLLAR